jgi:hypothetical protein
VILKTKDLAIEKRCYFRGFAKIRRNSLEIASKAKSGFIYFQQLSFFQTSINGLIRSK